MSASEIYSPAEEEAAFAETYSEHHQKLLRYCQYRLRDRHEAEDVMQEAFVRAWRSMPASAYGSNFYPWLRVVAANLCTDVLRKRSRSEPMADIELGSVDGGMDRITEEEDRALVRQALLRLNDRHRAALMMRESEGLTYDQIAERTGATSATVESLLWRARQALKREFTVVAGRTGAMAPLPLITALAARAAAARRRFTARLTRRMPGLSRALSDNPAGHLMLAAIATLTVVGGVAATLHATQAGGSATGASTAAPTSLVSALSRAAAVVAVKFPSAATSPTTTGAASRSSGSTSWTSPPATAAGSGGAASQMPSLATAQFHAPVTAGRSLAPEASKAPLAVTLFHNVALGFFPGHTVNYPVQVSAAVANTVGAAMSPTSNPQNDKTNIKENK